MTMPRAIANSGSPPLIAAIFAGRLPRPPVGQLLGSEYLDYRIETGEVHMRFTAVPSFMVRQ